VKKGGYGGGGVFINPQSIHKGGENIKKLEGTPPPHPPTLVYFMADLGQKRLPVYSKYKIECSWIALFNFIIHKKKPRVYSCGKKIYLWASWWIKNLFVAKTLSHKLTNSVYSRYSTYSWTHATPCYSRYSTYSRTSRCTTYSRTHATHATHAT
jgi:hypothetical protein